MLVQQGRMDEKKMCRCVCAWVLKLGAREPDVGDVMGKVPNAILRVRSAPSQPHAGQGQAHVSTNVLYKLDQSVLEGIFIIIVRYRHFFVYIEL